jgi:hypothetical protein
MNPRHWWRSRQAAKDALRAEAKRRNTIAGSILMTQAQALVAAFWALEQGVEQPKPDQSLQNLFLANTIALGFGPRALDPDAKAIWDLLASQLGMGLGADYPTIQQYMLSVHSKNPSSSRPPGYEFWASVDVAAPRIEYFARQLLELSTTDRQDIFTAYTERFCKQFGADDPGQLRADFTILLMHAGFTIRTVAEDTQASTSEEAEERLAMACEFEGRMLALAEQFRRLSEKFGFQISYGAD